MAHRFRAQSLPLVALIASGCVAPWPPEGAHDLAAPRAAAAPHRAPARARSTLVNHSTVRARVLPSGLLVLLELDPYATSAGVVSVIRGGTAVEPEGAEGVAHLVEHLTFSAVDAHPGTPLPLAPPESPRRPSTRREKLTRYAAAAINGLTSPDAITFFEFGPSSRLPWLLELEAARLTEPLAGVDEGAVALEREVIASEHQLRDDPRAGLWAASHLFPMMFPAGHPYARGAGTIARGSERLTLSDAKAYVRNHFRPERMTLLVSAPLASIDLQGIVQRLPPALVGDERHPIARPPQTEVAQALEVPAGPVLRKTSPLPAQQLWIGWTLPNGYGPLGPTEILLWRWVQEDMDLAELRQEDPHIRHVAVSLLPGREASALLLRVLIDGVADADRVAQVVSARVASLWTRARAEAGLLARLKATVESEVALDEPPQMVRAIEQAQMAALGNRPALRAETLVAVRDVADEDLARFAYEHLGQLRRHAVLFTPADPTVEATHRTHPRPASAAAHDDLFTSAASWDPMELPGVTSPVSTVVMKKLSTGLTILVARRRAASVVAWLGFHGGYSNAEPPLLVELALRGRPEAVEAPKYGALPGRAATRDASIETLEFPAVDLEQGLTLLFAKATTAIQSWPPRETLERMVASINADVDAASAQADSSFWRALFGDHPFARVVTPSDLGKVTRSDVDDWIGRVHNLRNAVLIVVGDVNVDEVSSYAADLSRRAGAPSWVGEVPAVGAPALHPPGPEHVATVVTPRAGALTDVRLGCLLPRMSAAERADYEILQLIIQERLSSALRVEHGEGYGVEAAFEWLRGGIAYLHVATFVDADVLPEALAALRHHWNRWASTGFEAGEINVGRWEYAGELSLASSSGSAIAYHLFNDWNADTAAAGRDTFRADPMSTTADRLSRLFATCRTNAVLALTGNEPGIRSALARSWTKLP